MDDIYNVNFKAVPLNRINVQKYNKTTKSFVPLNTTFVKLEHDNHFDLAAVTNSAKKWKKNRYMQRIATASHWMDNVPIEVYALTTQEKNFHRLNYKNILAFAEMRPDENNEKFFELCHLQVKPEAINVGNYSKKTYKYVGSSILKSLKKIYKNISLFSEGGMALNKFYKKNKFINEYNCQTLFLWSSNPFTRLKIYFDNFRKRVGI